MIVDNNSAFDIADKMVKDLAKSVGDDFAIAKDLTVITDQGWLFFYNTVDFINTGNASAALVGNGPIFIMKNGDVREIPSSIPWQEAIKE